jgi:hypothetical protein
MPNFKFLNLFLYSSKSKQKNLVVQTKFYWSWAGGLVLIVRTLFSETVAWISTSYATVRLVFIGGIVDHHCLSFHNRINALV